MNRHAEHERARAPTRARNWSAPVVLQLEGQPSTSAHVVASGDRWSGVITNPESLNPPIECLSVVGARPLRNEQALLAATELPLLMVGTLVHCRRPDVCWQVGSEPGGGPLRMTVTAAPDTLAEISPLLDELYLTESAAAQADERRWWTVKPRAGEVGFAPLGRAIASHWTPPSDQPDIQRGRKLLSLIGRIPGLAIRLHLAASPEPRQIAVSLSVGVDADVEALPARVIAAISAHYPGLQLNVRPLGQGDTPHPWQTDQAGVAWLLPLPVATAAQPLPGIAQGAPQPLAVRPLAGSTGGPSTGGPSTGGPSAGGVRIGATAGVDGQPIPEELTAQERLRPIHVTGRTGTGKSTALRALATGIASAGDGLLLLDPHGETVQAVVAELAKEAVDRVWLIDAGDLDRPVPLNPLAAPDAIGRNLAIQDITDVFYTLFDPTAAGIVGPRYEVMLRMALRGLSTLRGGRASLLDVPRVYSDGEIMQAIERVAVTEQERTHWKVERGSRSSHEYGDRVSWFTSKFDRFDGTAALRGILGTGADAFDPAKAMDDGRIILVDLSKGRLGEVASRLLGFLYITRFWGAALRRTDRRPFSVIVDEAHNFTAGSLVSMLSEGRKFGISAVVAHQYLGQLEPRLLDALAGNASTTIAFRAGPADAEVAARAMGGAVTADDFTTLPDLTALCLRTAGPVGPTPHTLLVDHNSSVTSLRGEALACRLSRIRARTQRDLIAPHRQARPLSPADLPGSADQPSEQSPKLSFVDDWMVGTRRLQAVGDDA